MDRFQAFLFLPEQHMARPSRAADLRAAGLCRGVFDILPALAAAAPIGPLWATLAAAKGFPPFEAWLTSATVFAGAAQFVTVDMWRGPVPATEAN